jgi:hypothetical protein
MTAVSRWAGNLHDKGHDEQHGRGNHDEHIALHTTRSLQTFFLHFPVKMAMRLMRYGQLM